MATGALSVGSQTDLVEPRLLKVFFKGFRASEETPYASRKKGILTLGDFRSCSTCVISSWSSVDASETLGVLQRFWVHERNILKIDSMGGAHTWVLEGSAASGRTLFGSILVGDGRQKHQESTPPVRIPNGCGNAGECPKMWFHSTFWGFNFSGQQVVRIQGNPSNKKNNFKKGLGGGGGETSPFSENPFASLFSLHLPLSMML